MEPNHQDESAPTALRGRTSAKRRRHRIAGVACAVAGVILLTAGIVTATQITASGNPIHPAAAASAAAAGSSAVAEPANLSRLPEARYDAVIAGLIPYTGGADHMDARYTIARDIAVYGADRKTPVAKLAASDFYGQPTTVVVADQKGGWSLVLTPARVSLPSKTDGKAPAQSAAWVPTAELTKAQDLRDRIVISASEQKLRIVAGGKTTAEFAVGVGTAQTPSPTNVTGYLEERYLDPSQGESTYPIQLTSLHSSVADEPYGGKDGGLIGVHYNVTNSGAVSHGCIRLNAEAIQAVNRLPLGTPITITP